MLTVPPPSDRQANLRVPLGVLATEPDNRRVSAVVSVKAKPPKTVPVSPEVRLATLRSQREHLEVRLAALRAMKESDTPDFGADFLSLTTKCVETKRRLLEKRAHLGETLDVLKQALKTKQASATLVRDRLQALTGTLNDSLLQHVDYDPQRNTLKVFSNPFIFRNLQRLGKTIR